VSETATTPVKTPFEYGSRIVISVNVSDFNAAVDWYAKAFGFTLEYRMDDYGWGEMRTPHENINIGLGQTEEIKNGGITPTWTVKDIDAARAHLESVGARFDGDTYQIEDMVRLVTFYDPDGNPWMLAQSLQPQD
jgi:predicted enzyme related to lactoylglutathione lyase